MHPRPRGDFRDPRFVAHPNYPPVWPGFPNFPIHPQQVQQRPLFGFGPARPAEFGPPVRFRPPVEPLLRQPVQQAGPVLPARKVSELRRSLFVPCLHAKVTGEELAAAFRNIGNIQELIIKDNGRSRFAIIIFVEEETAYDVLASPFTINQQFIYCEPRKIFGKTYTPRVPMDVTTPLRTQTTPGGRGVPFSIVAEGLPIVDGSAYAHDPHSAYRGPVGMRAPQLKPMEGMGFPPLGPPKGMGAMLNGGDPKPIVLPVKMPWGKEKATVKKRTKESTVLKSMPFLIGIQDVTPVTCFWRAVFAALYLRKMVFAGPMASVQMQVLVQHAQLTYEEVALREDMRLRLEKSFGRIFRMCRLRLYGSSANTFGVRGSDMDAFLELYLDSPEADRQILPREKSIKYYWNNVTQLQNEPYHPAELRQFTLQDILRLMEKLMRYLSHSLEWRDVVSIPSARTPILKLYPAYCDINIDVSISSKLVFQNTGLLYMYSNMDPRVRPLVFTVRRWAETKNLTGDTGFTKYGLTMLLVFYLHNTSPSVLPPPDQVAVWIESDEHLQRYLPQDGSMNFDLPCDCLRDIASSMPRSSNSRSPADLLQGFLEFYSEIDFPNTVLCGYSGEIIPKETFVVPSGEAFKFRYINLQDPFDLNHNIAKSVSLQTFVTLCQTLTSEVTFFSKKSINLVDLLETERDDVDDGPAAPVLVSVSGYRSSVPTATWIPQVPDMVKRILQEFLRCDSVQEIGTELAPKKRQIPHLGTILKDFHCTLRCRSWMNRRGMRRQLRKGKTFTGSLEEEWDLETKIGQKLQEWPMGQPICLDFYLTVIVNNVESERICLFLSAQENSYDIRDFFEFVWRFLPEQLRRFLKLDQYTVEAEKSIRSEEGDLPVDVRESQPAEPLSPQVPNDDSETRCFTAD